jgi:hypothetical protein
MSLTYKNVLIYDEKKINGEELEILKERIKNLYINMKNANSLPLEYRLKIVDEMCLFFIYYNHIFTEEFDKVLKDSIREKLLNVKDEYWCKLHLYYYNIFEVDLPALDLLILQA